MQGRVDAATQSALERFATVVAGCYPLSSLVLFGSRARGEAQPDSDADVAVLLKGQHRDFLETKLALDDLAFDVLLESGILIQPLPIWEDEWADPAGFRAPALLRNIQREGIVL